MPASLGQASSKRHLPLRWAPVCKVESVSTCKLRKVPSDESDRIGPEAMFLEDQERTREIVMCVSRRQREGGKVGLYLHGAPWVLFLPVLHADYIVL